MGLDRARPASVTSAVGDKCAGVTRHELAADPIADVRQLEQRITAVEAHIKTAVAQANTSLLGMFGVGPV